MKLDYGSGSQPKEGYLSSDFCGGPQYHYLIQDYKVVGAMDETFDTINCRNVIHHIPEEDLPKVFSEFKRLLKPGGRIVISEPRKEFHQQNLILDIIWYRFLKKEMSIVLPVTYVDFKKYLSDFRYITSRNHFNNEIIVFQK